MRNEHMQIAVVGAGIVGASIAYHLARRGAAVTLIDKGRAGGGVTADTFAWITVAHDLPEPYFRLRMLAISEYRSLQRELGGAVPVNWCGALSWQQDPAATQRMVSDHAALGYDVRLVERSEIARLEPGLIDPPELAAFAPSEAASILTASNLGARDDGRIGRPAVRPDQHKARKDHGG